MKRSLVFLAMIIALSMTFSFYLFADSIGSSSIKGTVTDKKTGEILYGANIYLAGTSIGAASDIDGNYVIPQVPPGNYTLKFRYIGYKEKEFEISVQSDKTIELSAELEFVAVEGNEVIISVQAAGQIGAINQQLSSQSIKNIVASDRIKEVPDVNAAESIGRLPGVSLKRSGGEGDKIVVRGLSPEFNIIEIDGVRLEGVGGDRSVGLSLISTEMLEGIELSKTLTPDKDADAIGGVVNLKLREAKEGLSFAVEALGAILLPFNTL